LNEKIKEFVHSKRFAQIASNLMKVNGVRLYHDQALLKPSKGAATPWHQDQYYWPLETKNTITMWMALKDCPKEMGPMIFGKGTH
jgi:ectoine hydroxylase-related dioxygenase (phytanoyl-CoA dioxygenase family)